MIGAGKYDKECEKVRTELAANGIVLMVFGGSKGSGFSIQAGADIMPMLPALLEAAAKELRKDIEKLMQ